MKEPRRRAGNVWNTAYRPPAPAEATRTAPVNGPVPAGVPLPSRMERQPMHKDKGSLRQGPARSGWRFGLALLLGAVAGATAFPRPARGGGTRNDKKDGLRAGPAPAAPGSAPPNG